MPLPAPTTMPPPAAASATSHAVLVAFMTMVTARRRRPTPPPPHAGVGVDAGVGDGSSPRSLHRWSASSSALGAARISASISGKVTRQALRYASVRGGGCSGNAATAATVVSAPALHDAPCTPAVYMQVAGAWGAKGSVGGGCVVAVSAALRLGAAAAVAVGGTVEPDIQPHREVKVDTLMQKRRGRCPVRRRGRYIDWVPSRNGACAVPLMSPPPHPHPRCPLFAADVMALYWIPEASTAFALPKPHSHACVFPGGSDGGSVIFCSLSGRAGRHRSRLSAAWRVFVFCGGERWGLMGLCRGGATAMRTKAWKK